MIYDPRPYIALGAAVFGVWAGCGAPLGEAASAAVLWPMVAWLAFLSLETMVDDRDAPTGVFHFANRGVATWCGFARAIFAGAAQRGVRPPDITPVTTAERPAPARRPANSALSTAAIERAYDMIPRPWTEALDEVLDTLVGPARSR